MAYPFDNPFGQPFDNPFGDPFGSPFGQRRRSPIPPLPPEEEDSLLQRLGAGAMGGLQYVGSSLNKAFGGRAIRGLLGGKPEELASIIPFSDTLGLTNPANEVRGADLTGLKGDDWGSWLGNLGAEVALDPGTYLTFGGAALSNAGKAARAGALVPKGAAGRVGTTLGQALAGASPEAVSAVESAAARMGTTTAALAGEKLGGHLGLGLPFMDPIATFDLTKPLGAARKAVATVGNLPGIKQTVTNPLKSMAAFVEPFVRLARAAVSPAMRDMTSAAGQLEAPGIHAEIEAARTAAAQKGLEAYRKLQAIPGALDNPADLRRVAEGIASPYTPGTSNEVGKVMNDVADAGRAFLDGKRQSMTAMGWTPGTLLDDTVEHWHRQATQLPKDSRGYTSASRGRSALPTSDKTMLQRKEYLTNVPGGTEGFPTLAGAAEGGVNPMTVDPRLSGVNRLSPSGAAAAQVVREHYLGMSPADDIQYFDLQQRAGQMGTLAPSLETEWAALRQRGSRRTPAEQAAFDNLTSLKKSTSNLNPTEHGLLEALKGKWEQAQDAAQALHGMDPQYLELAKQGKIRGLFSNNPLDDFLGAATAVSQTERGIAGIHRFFAKNAILPGFAGPVGPTDIPLSKALEKAGADNVGGALQHFAKELASQNGPLGNNAAAILPQLDKVYIPAKIAEDAGRLIGSFKAPQALGPIVDAFDSLTNLTKGYQTSLWPAFHSRNFLAGMWQNYVMGAFSPSAVTDAYKMVKGDAIPGASKLPLFASKGLTDEQATRALADGFFAHRLTGSGNLSRELIGSEPGSKIAEGIVGEVPRGIKKSFTQGGSWNPFDVGGVGRSNETQFAPMKAGRELGGVVEDVNRISGALTLLKKGYSMEEAAAQMRLAHIDYSALTNTERQVFKRLIPFYSWTSRNLPFQLEQLATRPGGPVALATKASGDVRDRERFIPDYLGGGVALPIGKEQDGTQRFLSSLGLPFEEAAGLIQPGSAERSLQALLGQTNPLLKGPLEYATGKQFFTGRELKDLHPITGNTLADQLIMNSPLARLETTRRTLMDERKWQDPYALPLNLLTGAKVSDVDLLKQKDVAARRLMGAEAKGSDRLKQFSELYVKPEDMALLSPRELALLQLQKSLQQRAKERAASRRVAQ